MENDEAMERIRHALRVPVGADMCELAYAAERMRSEHTELQRGVRTVSNTPVEDADAIIHALVDERVMLRSKANWYQAEAIELSSRIPADDPRGATDEDPLTDVERRVFEMLPATIEELWLRLSMKAHEMHAVIYSLWGIGAIRRSTGPGWVAYCPNDAFARTKEAAQ